MSLAVRSVDFRRYVEMLGHFSSEDVSLYHGAAWLESVRQGFGAAVWGALVESSGGEPLALMPVMEVGKGPFRLRGSPLRGMYTEFAGPLFAPELGEGERGEVLSVLHGGLGGGRVIYMEWGMEGGRASDVAASILGGLGYVYVPRATLEVDLVPGKEAVWATFESRARNMVRKAEKHGVSVKSITPGSEDVRLYYSMLTETFRRQGKEAPHPLSFFQAMCQLLRADDELRFYLAEKEGRIVGGAIFLHDRHRMVYLSGTSNEEGAKLAANSLVQWVAIQDAVEAGIRLYDLGGVGNERIDRFKASFGGRPFKHHRWVRKSGVVSMLEPVYRFMAAKGWVRLHG